MKVLNLYAGIGGNRKLWEDVDVTAVEIDQQTAEIYQDHFPNDNVILGDAHLYLLKHYKEFDFIWASPPCPTHSRARFWGSKGGMIDVKYPDMKLYQEILLLQHYFDGKWIVENVTPFYKPIIEPTAKIERHLFWSNFKIGFFETGMKYDENRTKISNLERELGFDLSGYNIEGKLKLLRNCVEPKIGEYILDRARDIIVKSDTEQTKLFG